VDWDESRHHEAGFDAQITAQIMINLARLKEVKSVESLCASVGVRLGIINDEKWRGCTVSQYHATEIQVNEDADEFHALYGKVVVFTGALYSMSRHEAWQRVAALGALPAENVTAKTNFLVIGEQDPAKLRPGDNQSSKFQKAAMLRGKGQDIEVITERDFLTFIEDVSNS
jgi:NAD-dependent DNA ligase